MKPSMQGGTLLPWTLPHANLFDSGENNWGYTDAMAEQQLREQLAFSTFSSYQVFLLIYNFGVLVAGAPGRVVKHFFSGRDGDGSQGVSSISDQKGPWSKKLKQFVVEAPWRRLAETWKLRNEPRVVELSDEQYVQCLKRADELYAEWFESGLGRRRSMVCHGKYQMDEYLEDGMRKSGYNSIVWGNLGEDDDAQLDWKEVFAAAAKEADEIRRRWTRPPRARRGSPGRRPRPRRTRYPRARRKARKARGLVTRPWSPTRGRPSTRVRGRWVSVAPPDRQARRWPRLGGGRRRSDA